MKKGDVILERQKEKLRFRNGDMDFYYGWAIGTCQLLGLSASQVMHIAGRIRDGDPDSWVDAFSVLGRQEALRAAVPGASALEAGQAHLGAAFAFRAAIQFADVGNTSFASLLAEMEAEFISGTGVLGIPLKSVEIPFEGRSLPGYFLEIDGRPRPTILMIGGGDSFREDLFCFAGHPGWKRGYNVLMIDLPGQGKTPGRDFTFRVDMYAPQKAAIDWLEANAQAGLGKLALYGISGGGYFTAQCAADDDRVGAWIAATPIHDIARLFRREFGAALTSPGWLMNLATKMSGSLNRAAEINLAKYAWQFGSRDFRSAIDRVLKEAKPVEWRRITCPSLFLVSEGEARELKAQADEIFKEMSRRGSDVTRIDFLAAEGADAHCELNNYRLLHARAFEWLDRKFGQPAVDPRMLC